MTETHENNCSGLTLENTMENTMMASFTQSLYTQRVDIFAYFLSHKVQCQLYPAEVNTEI